MPVLSNSLCGRQLEELLVQEVLLWEYEVIDIEMIQ